MKIYSKFTEFPCRSPISIKLLCNFTEIALKHGCSPVNLLHIFRTPLYRNTSGGLLLFITFFCKMLLPEAWWKCRTQSRDPRTPGTSRILRTPWDPPGPLVWRTEPLETPSNLRDLLEALSTPRISLGPRKDFAKLPVLRLIKPGDIIKEF